MADVEGQNQDSKTEYVFSEAPYIVALICSASMIMLLLFCGNSILDGRPMTIVEQNVAYFSSLLSSIFLAGMLYVFGKPRPSAYSIQ